MASFVVSEDETLADVLQQYAEACARTDAVVNGIDELGRRIPLPAAPWFPIPRTARSGGSCSTSSKRRHATPDMPTSSARRSMVR